MTNPAFKPPSSKQELIALISQTRTRISGLMADLDDAEMQRIPGPQRDRSVKDLLSHLTWWEHFMMQRILILKSGMQTSAITDLDAINEQVFRSHQNLPVSTVRMLFHQGSDLVIHSIEYLTWQEIDGGLQYAGKPIAYLIAGNTFDHYLQHLPQLEDYVNSLTTAG